MACALLAMIAIVGGCAARAFSPVGSWAIIPAPGSPPAAAAVAPEFHLDFRPDHTFEFRFETMKQRGTWDATGGTLTLTANAPLDALFCTAFHRRPSDKAPLRIVLVHDPAGDILSLLQTGIDDYPSARWVRRPTAGVK